MQSSLAFRFGAVIACTFVILFGYQNCSPQLADGTGTLTSSSTDPSTHITISSEPANASIAVGGSTYLIVAASSADGNSLYYQWYLNGGAVAGATSSVLTISNATTGGNEGYYSVSVSDGTYTVYSSSAWLQVGGSGSASSTGSCTVGSYNDTHCWLYVTTPMTFVNAASYCSGQGGYLATSASAADNAFIVSLTGGASAFLGGTNANTGYYVWQSGGVLSYTNWSPNEPNNAGGNEHCIEIYGTSGLWNDINCGTTLPFVCEI